jgi:hypothetical protein
MKRKSQQSAVLEIFRANPDWMSPSKACALLEKAGHFMLLTSVRCYCTRLTTAGLLAKHPHKRVKGPWGHTERVWMISAGDANEQA